MTSWLVETLDEGLVCAAEEEASRRRINDALGIDREPGLDDDTLQQIVEVLELDVFDCLMEKNNRDRLRQASARAFQLSRVVSLPTKPMERAEQLLRLGCLAVLGDRGADMYRILSTEDFDALELNHEDWGQRVWRITLDLWLRLIRKKGWSDLDAVQQNIIRLREAQSTKEPGFLESLESQGPAWKLVTEYHLSKAAEILAVFLGQGETPSGDFDIKPQLESHYQRAIAACRRSNSMAFENQVRLLEQTAYVLVENSIWTVTRAVNSRVTAFVRHIVGRTQSRPIFEMLPPQRRTLREQGLLGSAKRSVVVSLPTSSGKTMIAAFRILQALNQFDHERGWVVYVAPTRALVQQITRSLRKHFEPLKIVVEQVSPALEIDGLEATMLTEEQEDLQFRVLVTTPEKLDLMLRGGWEDKIGRPLTLTVVDEAHNLSDPHRGLKLELLLATINRECRYAQFLLLTPFIKNARQIAEWLDSESNDALELSLDWSPNDRMIALAENEKIDGIRGGFKVKLHPVHTSNNTLTVPEDLTLAKIRPLGLSWSKAKSRGALAAATAQQLKSRGTVVVLAGTVPNCLSLANHFKVPENLRAQPSEEIQIAKDFLTHEFGPNFPLIELLDYGVGIHNSGMSDETRTVMEWLTERGDLDILVATTTIADGVNFPLSSVVMGAHQYPYGQEMPPTDFWNLAGRAGRVDQGDLGIVAIASNNPENRNKIISFIQRNVGALNSSLVKMVQDVETHELLNLEQLYWKPEWSNFLQYLAHTYREMDDHERFALQIEQVLRGTFGFRDLQQSHPELADRLLYGVGEYAHQLRGEPLSLVDATGFSMESIRGALHQLKQTNINAETWSPELFEGPTQELQQAIGVLLTVPELRGNLEDLIKESSMDGDRIASAISDWVRGESLQVMADRYFDGKVDKCCQNLFSKITQTASWGIAALQSLTLGDRLEELDESQQYTIRNLPARIYYGVNSNEALVLRLNSVPRAAAEPLAIQLNIQGNTPVAEARRRLETSGAAPWRAAMGELGSTYHRIWTVLEGKY